MFLPCLGLKRDLKSIEFAFLIRAAAITESRTKWTVTAVLEAPAQQPNIDLKVKLVGNAIK